jgi:hypothetical protein
MNPTIPCLCFLSAFLCAQQEDATAGERASRTLQQQLRASAARSSMEFDLEWQWPRTTIGTATTSQSVGGGTERASGVAYADALSVRFERERTELLQVGRHTIMRQGDGPWRMASATPAPWIAFVPDPQRLLLALAEAAPAVTHREIVEVEGRACERMSTTLGADGLALLVDAGVLHDPNPMGGVLRRARALGQGRMPEPKVVPIDVVVETDVETRHVHAVRVRAIVEQIDYRKMVERLKGEGGGEHEAADAASEEVKAGGDEPLRFENGMPVRDAEGKMTYTLTLGLRRHDGLPALELDDTQKRLLGR